MVESGNYSVSRLCSKLTLLCCQFKFYYHSEDEAELLEKEKKKITSNLLRTHKDPFYNECPAYRISEAGLNGEIAVRCYGFLILPAAEETYFKKRFQVAT